MARPAAFAALHGRARPPGGGLCLSNGPGSGARGMPGGPPARPRPPRGLCARPGVGVDARLGVFARLPIPAGEGSRLRRCGATRLGVLHRLPIAAPPCSGSKTALPGDGALAGSWPTEGLRCLIGGATGGTKATAWAGVWPWSMLCLFLGLTLAACCSRAIHVFGFKSMMILPLSSTLTTVAGNQSLWVFE